MDGDLLREREVSAADLLNVVAILLDVKRCVDELLMACMRPGGKLRLLSSSSLLLVLLPMEPSRLNDLASILLASLVDMVVL